jgi:hypothetical protein
MPTDPLAPPIARALDVRRDLLELAGPTLSGSEVADLLAMTPEQVEQRRGARRLLAVEVEGGWRYPSFQFHGSRLLPGLEELFAAMEGYDPWSVLDILLAEDPAFDGRSLLAILRAGNRDSFARVLRQIGGDGFT